MTLPRKPATVASKADLRAILHGAGIAKAAAERIADGGWSALVEGTPKDTTDDSDFRWKYPSRFQDEDAKMSIQVLRERRGQIAASIKKLSEKPNFNAATDQPKWDSMMRDLDKIDREILAVHAQNESIANASVRVATVSAESREHLKAFEDFLRAPKDMRAQAALQDVQSFQNAASGGTDAAGGFLIPDIILGPLNSRAFNVNPFRRLVRTVQVDTRDVNFPLSNSNGTTGWVGEMAARTATAEPTLTSAKPTFGTLYSYVEASEELVMDAAFDIGSWFASEAGGKMGETEMAAIVSGDGTDKPSGLLKTAPTTGADGTRAAGVLKYLPTGAASTLGSAPSDLLITTVYDLKSGYRANGSWVMNSAVAGEIRKLKDSQGRFLWTDGIAQGEPSTLLGYPVFIAEAMAGVAANAFPIMFGDFERAYILCENGGLRVTVDDNVTVPGRVKWYIRRRLGGTVYDNDAVRAIKVAST